MGDFRRHFFSKETTEGRLYLAVVLDIFSRMVFGWAMNAYRDEALVDQSARMGARALAS